jgi:SRSO17 transposase
VERDYQELKQEIGLDHYEGRTWRGFHHHATLCAVAHGFLALRRALFPRRRKWTLAEVRRRLQQVLLRWVGYCPLCRRPVTGLDPPLGPSRM